MGEQYGLSEQEQRDLDSQLIITQERIPDDWKHFTFAVPSDFYDIMLSTIQAYKRIIGTEKTFPALEGIFLEARNSLPDNLLEERD